MLLNNCFFLSLYRTRRKWRSGSWVLHQSQRKSNLWSVMPKMSSRSSGEPNTTRISSSSDYNCTSLPVCLLSLLMTAFHFPSSSSFASFSVIIPWLFGTPQWAAGNVWAQSGENGGYICRHQRLHAAHDVSGHGRLSLYAGLGWSYELWREDRSAI